MDEKTKAKVLVLGLDSGDAMLIRRWSESGDLPVIRGLVERGQLTEMEDLPALWTGSVWPTLCTGASPSRHGYCHHYRYNPSTYDSERYHEHAYPVATLWDRLSEAGRRVAVLDVPLAPLSKSLNGVQLVDWGVHEPQGSVRSEPPELAKELVRRFGKEPVGQCDYGGRGPSDCELFRDKLCQRVETRTRLYEHVLEKGGWDLFFCVFTEAHCAGHQCWHLHDPEHPQHDPELADRVGDPVLEIYRKVDEAVGRLVQRAGPDAIVLLVATHGMGPSYRTHFLLDRVLQKIEGVAAPRSRLFNALYRWWRLLPVNWRLALRPVGQRARKRLGAGARRNRKSFELSTHCAYGTIRVNLQGREPSGQVPAEDFTTYLEFLRKSFLELVATDSGEPLVENVWITSDHYERSPSDRLPDMVVEWARDVEATGVYSPKFGFVNAVTPNDYSNRTGNHRPHGGLLLRSGPGVQRGELARSLTAMDLAPTVFEALGIEPTGLDGRPAG